MVIAVITMGMMQVPVHQVIYVIAVGYRRVSTVRAVDVACVVSLALVRGATVGIDV